VAVAVVVVMVVAAAPIPQHTCHTIFDAITAREAWRPVKSCCPFQHWAQAKAEDWYNPGRGEA